MDSSLPLPLYRSERTGSVNAKDGQEFSIVVGLDKNLVAQLKEKSLDKKDTELQNNTSDYRRFGTGSYEEWYAKERTPYALVSEDGKLAALAWFGPKPLGRKSLRFLSEEELANERHQEKNEWHTIVYRSYDPFRGKGIMTPFVRFAMSDYRSRVPGIKLWAGIDSDNAASIGLAEKLGFKIAPEYSDPEAHWLAMIEAS